MKQIILILAGLFILTGCNDKVSSQRADSKAIDRQQSQYAKAQPVPAFDYSLERDLLIQLYQLRNQKVATHSVWRSDFGMIENDCPSIGYPLPYDASLTNPWVADRRSGGDGVAIGQPEPNGIFQSTNSIATWVVCTGPGGVLEPIFVESKVRVYPYPVTVDYEEDRVYRAGEASATVTLR